MSQPWGDRQGESLSPGQMPGQAPGQMPGQAPWTGPPPTAVQPYPAQPYSAQPYAAQPYAAQPYAAQPYSAQPYSAQLYPAGPIAGGTLVSAGGRFGAFLLDGLLILVTLGIGYLIWSLVTWSDGQTPAKKLLGQVVVDGTTGVPFDWGRMALRQFVIQGLLGWLLNVVTLGIYFWVDALMVFGDRQRTLHDRMANSVVRYV
jgi:uncharacterized RDD family membrane protein YckC